MQIINSWEYSDHSFPVIALSYCRNSTANEKWCKPPEIIDEWLSDHVQYFVLQDTRVQSKIWEDHPVVQQFPYYGDEENYFPTLRQMKEQTFNIIQIEPNLKHKQFTVEDVFFGLHKVETIDSAIWSNKRELEYVNLIRTG